jgi:pyrroline-5-carboxylate reductase
MDVNAIKVGIIGSGQLGLSIAKQFITKGLPKNNLFISFRGNEETKQRIDNANLYSCIASNNEIAENCTLIFITVKPSNISNMLKMKVKEDAILISCVAGHEIKTIEALFHHTVYKIMPTSPESIENETAICGIYPSNTNVNKWLKWLGFELFTLNEESEFHYFTAMACMPAALLQIKIQHIKLNEAALFEEAKQAHFEQFELLYNRLKTETPTQLNEAESLQFIRKMTTKGGITESVVNSIKQGETLIQAIDKGIKRSQEIANN